MSEPPGPEAPDLEAPDLEALARRYLDLWQDQATALAGDAELTRQVGRWLTTMQAGMAHAFESFAPGARPSSPASTGPGPTPGSPPPAAPSVGGDAGLDELARRLAAVEERLARLEAGAQGGGRKPGRRRRKGEA